MGFIHLHKHTDIRLRKTKSTSTYLFKIFRDIYIYFRNCTLCNVTILWDWSLFERWIKWPPRKAFANHKMCAFQLNKSNHSLPVCYWNLSLAFPDFFFLAKFVSIQICPRVICIYFIHLFNSRWSGKIYIFLELIKLLFVYAA